MLAPLSRPRAIDPSTDPHADRPGLPSGLAAGPRRSAAIVGASGLAWFASLAGAQCAPGSLFGPVALDGPAGVGSFSIDAVDLDGDGDTDLVMGRQSQLTVWLNAGDGTFAPTVYTGDAGEIAIADLDGDGDPDIVSGGTGDYDSPSETGAMFVWFNDGDGVFTPDPSGPLSNTVPVSGLELSDIDGDGDPDILMCTASFSFPTFVWFNQGGGVFNTAFDDLFLDSINDDQSALVAADLDGDGDADIATTAYSLQAVTVRPGNGDGTVAPGTSYAVGGRPLDIALGDLDGDGDTDIAVVTDFPAGVGVLLGNGDGSFATSTSYGVGAGRAESIALGDLDADGDIDIAIGSENQGFVAVLPNNGDGTFAPNVIFTGFSRAAGLVLADLDGDVDLDLAAADVALGLGVLTNICDPFVPMITAQPETRLLASVGDDAQTLTVVATGTVGFQWRFNGEPIADGENYAGAGTDTLSITPVPEAVGFYDVLLTGLGGEAVSETALLAVANDCVADLNGDDLLDLSDIVGFVAAFTSGCP